MESQRKHRRCFSFEFFPPNTPEGAEKLAQIELFNDRDKYENKVYVLPKKLDEHVARLHLRKLGAELTQLNEAQCRYIGVDIDGPYKPDHYRY